MKNITNSSQEQDKSDYIGHRDRVKDLFLSTLGDNNTYNDKYLLEILLFYSIPRKDIKALANKILLHFGSLANLLSTDLDNLLLFKDISKNTIVLLQLLQKTNYHISLSKIKANGNVLQNFGDLIEYAKLKIAYKPYECVYIVFLNSKYKYLFSKIIGVGDVESVVINTKEIIIKSNTAPVKYVAIFHNHPSGDPKPSVADLQTTHKTIELLKNMNIELIDHIVISPNGHFSILNEVGFNYAKNVNSK